MKEIVVLSGKGGTGKTSVTASFAALSNGAVLADYDVDAADLHLVLNPKKRRNEDFICGHTARIDPKECMGCGQCKQVCRFEAIIETRDGPACRYSVDPLSCEGCGVCKLQCKLGAIALEPRHAGKWFISNTPHGPLVHARLGPAAQNSGKLVSLLRHMAHELASRPGMDLIIGDGSPGIGCPVIASLTGASFVVFVAEPTISGLHDLKRIMELAKHFKIPGALIVNKADLNTALSMQLEHTASQAGFALLGRILYSAEFTEAQVAGKTVIEHANGPASAAVREIWSKLQELLMFVESSTVGQD